MLKNNLYIRRMKYLIFSIFVFLLYGCEKYVTEIPTITLSGKYVVSMLEVTNVDQNMTKDSLYTLGSTYKNKSLPKPFDSIKVNNFYLHFDYSYVSMNLLGVTPDGRDVWDPKYKNMFYNNFGGSPYNFGYIRIELPTTSVYFKIENDDLELLQLTGLENWPLGKVGSKEQVTFLLRRVGP
jgi:hypothetical protein